MITELAKIYDRDLSRLEAEINAFQHEENLWKVAGSVKNSAGNLCLHLMGNLNTFVGKNLGRFDYIRNREAEFSLKDVPRLQLLAQLQLTKHTVVESITGMNTAKLEDLHPEDALGFRMTNSFFLIHLAGHLSYHLGQINYLRRILE